MIENKCVIISDNEMTLAFLVCSEVDKELHFFDCDCCWILKFFEFLGTRGHFCNGFFFQNSKGLETEGSSPLEF
jgi:hypothetical protein